MFSGCYAENGILDREDKGAYVDDRLKELMQELGNAINESLSDSDRIAAAIGEIKGAGYDVFLVLEATIGFNRRDDEDQAGLSDDEALFGSEPEALEKPRPKLEEPPKRESRSRRRFDSTGKIRWTTQDHKFLRALKISVEDDSSS